MPVLVPELIQAVVISAFGMDNFAEETLLRHVQGRELKEIVNAVFQHHAVQALAFGLIYEGPNLFQGGSRRHFYSHMLAVLHCI